LLGLIIGLATPKATAQMPDCEMILDTLDDCVTHHWEMGQIHSKILYKILLLKVKAAILAEDHGKTKLAINILNAFINEVNAQSGKKIDSDAAVHMIMHANSAISKLQNP